VKDYIENIAFDLEYDSSNSSDHSVAYIVNGKIFKIKKNYGYIICYWCEAIIQYMEQNHPEININTVERYVALKYLNTSKINSKADYDIGINYLFSKLYNRPNILRLIKKYSMLQ